LCCFSAHPLSSQRLYSLPPSCSSTKDHGKREGAEQRSRPGLNQSGCFATRKG
jgi:hypothetical protein